MKNRTIEFRAWDATTGEMHYAEERRHDTIKVASAHILKHYDDVMQFTGLHDRNGKKIFEGDVVKCLNSGLYRVWFGEQLYHSEEYGGKMGAIGFHIGEGNDAEPLGLSGLSATAASNPYEVVGNIFEHPNLIAQ
jgi:uncharacterized phage protein (TIGR01671 family)